jgi:5-(hydroxymethyl)furfural/furfural oxidase
MVIKKVNVEGYRFDQLMQDNEALEDFIRTAEIGVWHASVLLPHGRRWR